MSTVLVATGLGLDVKDGDRMRCVLDGISMSLARGELVALRGPSGSGKTTLLALLGGLATPTRGDVLLDGRSIVRMRDHHRTALRRRRIGCVMQELALLPNATLLDNVLLPFVPEGIRGADREAALGWLERFGLAGRAHTVAGRLSGGEKQRAAIARALVMDPAILLLDEPTAHVDAETAQTLVDELVRLRDDGRAILVSTHDPRVVADSRIDRALSLDRGRLVAPTPAPHAG